MKDIKIKCADCKNEMKVYHVEPDKFWLILENKEIVLGKRQIKKLLKFIKEHHE